MQNSIKQLIFIWFSTPSFSTNNIMSLQEKSDILKWLCIRYCVVLIAQCFYNHTQLCSTLERSLFNFRDKEKVKMYLGVVVFQPLHLVLLLQYTSHGSCFCRQNNDRTSPILSLCFFVYDRRTQTLWRAALRKSVRVD